MISKKSFDRLMRHTELCVLFVHSLCTLSKSLHSSNQILCLTSHTTIAAKNWTLMDQHYTAYVTQCISRVKQRHPSLAFRQSYPCSERKISRISGLRRVYRLNAVRKPRKQLAQYFKTGSFPISTVSNLTVKNESN